MGREMPHVITDVKDWSDFDWFINQYLPKQTVPVLRTFGTTIENLSGIYLGFRSQERKALLLDKIAQALQTLQTKSEFSTYRQIRQTCEQMGVNVRNYGIPQPPPNIPPPTFGGVPNPSVLNARYNNPISPGTGGFGAHAGPSRLSVPASSGWNATGATASAYNRPVHTLLDWKPNPMWKPLQAITAIEMLPDILASENNHVRKERRVNFILPPDVIDKLQTSRSNPLQAPHHSLRLFATSSEQYRPPNAGFQPGSMSITNRNIPIEFPASPDVTVDDVPLAFKERGLRGKAGSAPPFDLGKAKVTPGGSDWRAGRMVAVNVGHTGPTTGKKKEGKRFWFQVVLAEMTTKEELLAKLMKLVPTPADEIIAKARAKAEADEDIVAGTSIMTFKDPLSYMRITRPIRSSKCAHIQCFDATWWIESNSQHPQWQCPLCSKELKFDDLIVDGYFSSILDACPEEVDQVVLESDLEWHTENGKFGSKTWMAQNPAPATTAKETAKPSTNGNAERAEREPSRSVKPDITPTSSPPPDPKGKRKAIEILSSDSEEDGQVPSRSSNTNGNGEQPFRPPPASRLPSTTSNAAPTTGVIDLTLDSSDEDDDPPPPPRSASTSNRAIPPPNGSSLTTNSPGFHQPDVVEGGLRVPPLQPPIPPDTTSYASTPTHRLDVPNVPLTFGYPSLASRLANPPAYPSFGAAGASSGMGGVYDVRRKDEGQTQQQQQQQQAQPSLPYRPDLGPGTSSGAGAGRGGLSSRLSREDPLTGGFRATGPAEYRGIGGVGRYGGDHWEPGAEDRARWGEPGYRARSDRDRERSRERERERDRDRDTYRDRDRAGVAAGGGRVQGHRNREKDYGYDQDSDGIDGLTPYSFSASTDRVFATSSTSTATPTLQAVWADQGGVSSIKRTEPFSFSSPPVRVPSRHSQAILSRHRSPLSPLHDEGTTQRDNTDSSSQGIPEEDAHPGSRPLTQRVQITSTSSAAIDCGQMIKVLEAEVERMQEWRRNNDNFVDIMESLTAKTAMLKQFRIERDWVEGGSVGRDSMAVSGIGDALEEEQEVAADGVGGQSGDDTRRVRHRERGNGERGDDERRVVEQGKDERADGQRGDGQGGDGEEAHGEQRDGKERDGEERDGAIDPNIAVEHGHPIAMAVTTTVYIGGPTVGAPEQDEIIDPVEKTHEEPVHLHLGIDLAEQVAAEEPTAAETIAVLREDDTTRSNPTHLYTERGDLPQISTVLNVNIPRDMLTAGDAVQLDDQLGVMKDELNRFFGRYTDEARVEARSTENVGEGDEAVSFGTRKCTISPLNTTGTSKSTITPTKTTISPSNTSTSKASTVYYTPESSPLLRFTIKPAGSYPTSATTPTKTSSGMPGGCDDDLLALKVFHEAREEL